VIQAYEIQTCQGGVWQVDPVFDDEELAVFEARSLHERGRYVGVRVVLDIYNEETDQVPVWTILKLSKADEDNAAARKRKAEADKEIRENKKRGGEIKDDKQKVVASKKAEKNTQKAGLVLVARLTVILVLGLALLIGVRIIFEYM
jgi:hypothetical protein